MNKHATATIERTTFPCPICGTAARGDGPELHGIDAGDIPDGPVTLSAPERIDMTATIACPSCGNHGECPTCGVPRSLVFPPLPPGDDTEKVWPGPSLACEVHR